MFIPRATMEAHPSMFMLKTRRKSYYQVELDLRIGLLASNITHSPYGKGINWNLSIFQISSKQSKSHYIPKLQAATHTQTTSSHKKQPTLPKTRLKNQAISPHHNSRCNRNLEKPPQISKRPRRKPQPGVTTHPRNDVRELSQSDEPPWQIKYNGRPHQPQS